MIVLLLLLGCPRGPASLPDVPLSPVAPSSGASQMVVRQVGVGSWRGSGVAISVPSGWSGEEPLAGDVLLRLAHERSGVGVVLLANRGGLPEHPDCAWSFDDSAAWHTLQQLGVSRTASCVPDDPVGPLVQAWLADDLIVELVTPHGRHMEGLVAAEAVLRSMRRE